MNKLTALVEAAKAARPDYIDYKMIEVDPAK